MPRSRFRPLLPALALGVTLVLGFASAAVAQIRLSLRDLLPRLDPQRFWQVHRGLVVQARHILAARREETGRVLLTLRGRPETLVASRMFAHLFRGM